MMAVDNISRFGGGYIGQSELPDFIVTLGTNGYRAVTFPEDSISCQAPAICSRKRKRLLEYFVEGNSQNGGIYSKAPTEIVNDGASLQGSRNEIHGNDPSHHQDPVEASNVLVIETVAGVRYVSPKQVADQPSCFFSRLRAVGSIAGCASPNVRHPEVFTSRAADAAAVKTFARDEPVYQELLSRCSANDSPTVLKEAGHEPKDASPQSRTTRGHPKRQSAAASCGILASPIVQTPDEAGNAVPRLETSWSKSSSLLTANAMSSNVLDSSSKTRPRCQLPFNGHREELNHMGICPITLNGIILREEHANWLNSVPYYDSAPHLVNLIIGSSCREILLKGQCKEKDCTRDHTIGLNFNFPPKFLSTLFTLFIKWFLQNATAPDFRALLLLHSCFPRDHDNALMVALTFVKVSLKLSNKIFRQAICIKLVELMVNTVAVKPWEAVRTVLMFAVSPDMEQADILDLLSSLGILERTDLYESISCLWHINKQFSCPPEMLLKILEECLNDMPVDLKLTKDRMIIDLLKLPRQVLREKYVFIDQFFGKYYPMNSETVVAFTTSVLYRQNYKPGNNKPCRVKHLGPVNPKWDYWDIQEERVEGFQLVIKQSQKKQSHVKTRLFRRMTNLSYGNDFNDDMSCHDVFKALSTRNLLWCHNSPLMNSEEPDDLDALVEALHLGNNDEVAKIIASYDQPDKANSLHLCMHRLQWEFLNCRKTELHRIAQDILERLPGSLADEDSVKTNFVRLLNSLVVCFYQKEDYSPAIALVKTMRSADVNHLEHVPNGIDSAMFTIMNSDVHFQAKLYPEAVRALNYKHSLVFEQHAFVGVFMDQFFYCEQVVTAILRRFLRERCAVQAISVFRVILAAQRDLHYPINLGKFYEGVIFLSFLKDLKKNACAPGDGATLYVTVDRICGNTVCFHSITYRSLLVELERVNAPIDMIRRVLWICLSKNIYPNFSNVSPLVLGSHLAQEEMSIYLKNYFAFHAARHTPITPFVIKISSSPPGHKPFPVSNDIMKTPRSVPEALNRLRTALDDIAERASYSHDSVTIQELGLHKLANPSLSITVFIFYRVTCM